MKASTGDLVQTYSSPTPGRRGGSGESSAPVSPTAFVHDPYELERSELEAYLQNTTYFPTKTSLLEFARRYNVPVNARTQREEIIRLCLRMIHDIPAGFAGLRAAEKEPLTHPPGNVETRKVLEDFFTSTKSEGQLESTTIKKITGGLLDSILHCHEATVLLAQVRRADASLFSQVLETCEGPIETHMRLLRNLLDFSRLGTGKVQLVSVPFHLRRCLAELMQDMAALAQQKDLELCYEIKPDVPDTLVGDRGRLRQVLSNLIENAIKFTEHGEVVVEVKSQKSKVKSQTANLQTLDFAPETLDLYFAVRDTGIGFPKETLPDLTHGFSEASGPSKANATGLGLAIAKRLVELMHGRLAVQSEAGAGSTVTFTVQCQKGQPFSTESFILPSPLQGRRILIVDDNSTQRRIAQDLLGSWGLHVQTAVNGREALSLLYKAQGVGTPFSLILIDGHLPDMNGFALIRQQNLDEEPTQVSPMVLLLTTMDPAENARRCQELGAAAFVRKPLNPVDLFVTLTNVLLPQEEQQEEVVVDHAALWSLIAGDAVLLKELSAVFWESCPKLLFDLQHAVLTEDVPQLLAATHTLKGMVSTFAARRVLHVLAMVEAAGRQGNLPQAHAATVDLLGEISRLKSQLTELPPLSTEERLGVGKKEAV